MTVSKIMILSCTAATHPKLKEVASEKSKNMFRAISLLTYIFFINSLVFF
uniref:Uncharacterized protein n=1 Tax=Daucus carota subsp. sativus TaxID=79200 RepID=A0A175YI02_DAUCS